jgi:multicomponent Na+:H+ antiporter subunit E
MSASTADRAKCFGARWLFCLLLWSIVSGLSIADFAIGCLAAAAAAWASVAYFPCCPEQPGWAAWALLILRIPLQALVAGVQVARRALDPALPLQPGFIAYSTRLPEGRARNIFAAFAALYPGSTPVRTNTAGDFDIHCLDTNAPIGAALASEEERVRRALGVEQPHG